MSAINHRLLPALAALAMASACRGCPETHEAASATAAVAVDDGWVAVQAAKLSLGSPKTEPCRDGDENRVTVTLTQRFMISAYEVTQREFAVEMGYNPSYREGCESCPVDSVTHHEAAAYCNALSSRQGLAACYSCRGAELATRCEAGGKSPLQCRGYRLPTEAEWEHAARAGTKTMMPSGRLGSCMSSDDVADTIAWYKSSAEGQSHPVGTKQPNRWGLYDMAGNVYEWTADWYAPELPGGRDPLGPPEGHERVLRGGSWYHNAEHARSANRLAVRPDKRLSYVGFRCVRTIDES